MNSRFNDRPHLKKQIGKEAISNVFSPTLLSLHSTFQTTTTNSFENNLFARDQGDSLVSNMLVLRAWDLSSLHRTHIKKQAGCGKMYLLSQDWGDKGNNYPAVNLTRSVCQARWTHLCYYNSGVAVMWVTNHSEVWIWGPFHRKGSMPATVNLDKNNGVEVTDLRTLFFS